MAYFQFGAGNRAQALAHLVEEYNKPVALHTQQSEAGESYTRKVEAPCLVITREMIKQAYFHGAPEFDSSLDKWMDFYSLTSASGKLVRNDREKIILCDDDGDKAMSLRYKAYHQAEIARYSERLGISRNDFVVKAIEHYIDYLSSLNTLDTEE